MNTDLPTTATTEEIAAALAETPSAGGAPPTQFQQPPAPEPSTREIADAIRTGFQGIGEYFGERNRPQQPPQPMSVRQMIANMNDEQRAELERRIAQNPVGSTLDLAEMMSREQIAAFQQQAQPLISNTGAMLIDNYITRKSQEDPLYKQITPHFRKSVEKINKTMLAQMTDSERAYQLDLFWDAATSHVYRQAGQTSARPPVQQPPTFGGGGSAGPAPTSTAGRQVKAGRQFSDPALDRDDGLTELVGNLKRRGMLDDADVAQIEQDYSDVIV